MLLHRRRGSAAGGDRLTQDVLFGRVACGYLAGPISHAAGTPGGLFAPLLALGALWGTIVHAGVDARWPGFGGGAGPLAAVGMVAFFAAAVRAPLTGIVLITEMTAPTSLLVPMAIAAACAVLAATLLRNPPIYDSLRERMLRPPGAPGSPEPPVPPAPRTAT